MVGGRGPRVEHRVIEDVNGDRTRTPGPPGEVPCTNIDRRVGRADHLTVEAVVLPRIDEQVVIDLERPHEAPSEQDGWTLLVDDHVVVNVHAPKNAIRSGESGEEIDGPHGFIVVDVVPPDLHASDEPPAIAQPPEVDRVIEDVPRSRVGGAHVRNLVPEYRTVRRSLVRIARHRSRGPHTVWSLHQIPHESAILFDHNYNIWPPGGELGIHHLLARLRV